MQTSHRLGTFFILVGIAFLVLFIGSILSAATYIAFLPIAFVALLAGFLLRRNRPVNNDSGRFGAVRRAQARSRQRREERNNKQQKK
ncbi:MAG: hypothetical protein WCE68_06125 [Anaerolineales bacterium]